MYRGAVAVPMNPLLKAREVAYYLSNSGAKALFAAPGFARRAERRRRRSRRSQCWIVDDAALIDADRRSARAGGTGKRRATTTSRSSCTPREPPASPRAPMLTHGGLGRNAEVSVRTLVGPGRTTWSWAACRCFMSSA